MNQQVMLGNGHADGADEDACAEFEADIEQRFVSSHPAAGGSSHQLSMGAIPQHNGVLSKHAAEFWFPECRNCLCCKGFKHGCPCCVGAINTCKDAGCVDGAMGEKSDQSAPDNTFLPPPPFAQQENFEQDDYNNLEEIDKVSSFFYVLYLLVCV